MHGDFPFFAETGPTIFVPFSDLLSTIFRPLFLVPQKIGRPFSDHFPTIFGPFSNHFPTIFRFRPVSDLIPDFFRPVSDLFPTCFRPISGTPSRRRIRSAQKSPKCTGKRGQAKFLPHKSWDTSLRTPGPAGPSLSLHKDPTPTPEFQQCPPRTTPRPPCPNGWRRKRTLKALGKLLAP